MKTLTIGLLWHSVNSDNLGVGALTAGHIAILDQVARDVDVTLRYRILGWSDPQPAYVTGANVEVVALSARDFLKPSGLYSALRGCDIVLDISAGDSFADIYGVQRFLYNILSKLTVFAARRPLLLSPQTIGPFQRRWTRALAATVMRGAHKVVTRDVLSSDYLKSLGLGHKLIEACDVALKLPYEPAAPIADGKVRVGLNVSGLLFNGGYTQKNQFDLVADYAALVRDICRYFASREECELHLVGHVNSRNHVVEDDYRVCEALAQEFPGAVLAPRFESPSAAKSYISGLDFFMGARMHACIAAFSSGVPVLPMAYSRKFAGLFGTIGYDHLVDCRSQPADEILATVMRSYEERDRLTADLQIALAEGYRKLGAYEAVLKTLLEARR